MHLVDTKVFFFWFFFTVQIVYWPVHLRDLKKMTGFESVSLFVGGGKIRHLIEQSKALKKIFLEEI